METTQNTAKPATIEVAMLAAQRNMSNAKKGSDNPYFKSKYADLNSVREAVVPALMEQDILLTQPEVIIDGRNYVRTLLTHVPSGTSICSDVEILMVQSNNPQAQGSAITYARRYGLQSICGIGAEDDDANAGAKQPKQSPTPAVPATGESNFDLTLACQEIKEAPTMQDLQKVWSRYKSIQANPQFTQAKDNRKNELSNANQQR